MPSEMSTVSLTHSLQRAPAETVPSISTPQLQHKILQACQSTQVDDERSSTHVALVCGICVLWGKGIGVSISIVEELAKKVSSYNIHGKSGSQRRFGDKSRRLIVFGPGEWTSAGNIRSRMEFVGLGRFGRAADRADGGILLELCAATSLGLQLLNFILSISDPSTAFGSRCLSFRGYNKFWPIGALTATAR